MPRPDLTRVPDHFHNYINQAEGDDLMKVLKKQTRSFEDFLNEIPKSKRNYRYAEGKWSIKDIILHLADCERVIIYRAMRIARADKTNLPGFDEDLFVSNANADKRGIENIVAELKAYRAASICFINSLDEESLERSGTANNFPLTARLLVNHLYGHHRHHLNIINERYLPAFK